MLYPREQHTPSQGLRPDGLGSLGSVESHLEQAFQLPLPPLCSTLSPWNAPLDIVCDLCLSPHRQCIPSQLDVHRDHLCAVLAKAAKATHTCQGSDTFLVWGKKKTASPNSTRTPSRFQDDGPPPLRATQCRAQDIPAPSRFSCLLFDSWALQGAYTSGRNSYLCFCKKFTKSFLLKEKFLVHQIHFNKQNDQGQICDSLVVKVRHW